jgi:protein-S-isoprenylcysteine O-methyltransferase Ste14
VSGLLANPARLAMVVATVALSVVVAASPFNVSAGRRADVRDLWILPVGVVLTVLLVWLPPSLDHRDRWVIDGDGVRWVGVALFVGGGALRLWPIFVLGRRFSAVVAIQEHHELVTSGPYRWVRNPSYLGGLISLVGWALVFRSVAGLVLVLPFLWILVSRMDAEERLLASEFGPAYEGYRQRTWRLVPWLY